MSFDRIKNQLVATWSYDMISTSIINLATQYWGLVKDDAL